MDHALRSAVTHYTEHFQDVTWVESLFAQHGIITTLRTCAGVLDEQDPDEAGEVMVFLRDIGIWGIIDESLVTRVRDRIPEDVLPSLRTLLRAPALLLRMAAIFTLGKLSFASEAKALREVFPAYLNSDPVCLARMLGELSWLGDRRGVQACVKRALTHESYLVRWSVLGYLERFGTASGAQNRLYAAHIRRLSADPAPPVATEARYRCAALALQEAGREAKWWPKADWKKKQRALDAAQPAITFSTLESRFLDHMEQSAQRDYDLQALAAFVLTLEAT